MLQHSAVAESAKALLDAAQDVPCDLLAKVLKCLLLQLKRQHQQNRESEQVRVWPRARSVDPASRAHPPLSVKCQDRKAEEDEVDTETREKKTKLKRRGEVGLAVMGNGPARGAGTPVLLLNVDLVSVQQMDLRTGPSSTSCSLASTSRSSSQPWTPWAFTSPPSSDCVPGIRNRESVARATRSASLLQVSGAAAERSRRPCPASRGSWRLPETKAELARKLDLFWSELVPVLNSGSAASGLPDVVQLSCAVQTHSPEAEVRPSPNGVSSASADLQHLLFAAGDWNPHLWGRGQAPVRLPGVAPTTPALPPQRPARPRSGLAQAASAAGRGWCWLGARAGSAH